jgi:cytochrome P450
MNSLLPTTPFKSEEFLAAFEESLMGMGLRIRAGPISKIKLYFDKSWEKAYQKVHQFVDQHVERALRETSAEIRTGKAYMNEEETKPPQKYILVREMAKEIRDKVSLRYELMSVFFPGRDTIPVLLANTIFFLARQPSTYKILRRTAISLTSQHITYDLLKSLTYFKHVLFESLRLLPPVALVHRTALRDTILPNGGGPDGQSPIYVAKGEMVVAHLHALHRDKDIWGDDANEFNPGRWEGRRTLWDFVPFYGGARICPAQQQVMTQATYVLLRLAQEFEGLENRDEELMYIGLTRMVTESRNGVKVAFIRH